MAKKILLAGLLGGLALFVWESLAHMVLPLGDAGVKALANEKAVSAALKENIKEDGFYIFPAPDIHPGMTSAETQQAMNKAMEAHSISPAGIMVVHPNGEPFSFPKLLAAQFGFDLVSMLLIAALLAQTRLSSYGSRLIFITALGLLPWLRSELPLWNWYGFPSVYIAAQCVVQVVGNFVAGLVIAKLLGGATSRSAH